jgi:transposase
MKRSPASWRRWGTWHDEFAAGHEGLRLLPSDRHAQGIQRAHGAGQQYPERRWDGTGLCLFAKRLEKSRFVWPPLVDGGFQMSTAQLGLLLEGMDWRRTVQIDAPRQPVYA